MKQTYNRTQEICDILDGYGFLHSLKGYNLLRDAISIMVDHEEFTSLAQLYQYMEIEGLASATSLPPCIQYTVSRSNCTLATKELIFSVASRLRNKELSAVH